MKKKIVIIIAIILILIIGTIAYFVISDLKQEEKLRTEMDEVYSLMGSENIDYSQIEERLNRVVTKGDYATIEKALKNFLSDSVENNTRIYEILADERIVNNLTPENYRTDGPEFVQTKEYLANTIRELQECKEKYANYLTEENIMSYISDKNIDTYYIDLYKNEITGETEDEENTVVDDIDETLEILNITQEVINFLAENKNSWYIENDNIYFNSEDMSNKYIELISKITE